MFVVTDFFEFFLWLVDINVSIVCCFALLGFVFLVCILVERINFVILHGIFVLASSWLLFFILVAVIFVWCNSLVEFDFCFVYLNVFIRDYYLFGLLFDVNVSYFYYCIIIFLILLIGVVFFFNVYLNFIFIMYYCVIGTYDFIGLLLLVVLFFIFVLLVLMELGMPSKLVLTSDMYALYDVVLIL